MARIRTIKPEFFDDEELAGLSPLTRLAFVGLWCQADKAGRLEDRPARLKSRILPHDAVNFDAVLEELATARFILRYLAGGRRLIQVRTFHRHQRPRSDEDESTLPPPTADAAASLHRDAPDTAETLGKEGKGSGTEGKGDESAEALTRSTPTFCEFPVVGRDGPRWQLSEALVAEWATAYPNLDVPAEMRKARAWLTANEGRRKTARGMPTFLVNWLNRATDDRRGGTDRRSEDRGSRDRRAGGWTFDCCHEPPCQSAMDCVRKRRMAS